MLPSVRCIVDYDDLVRLSLLRLQGIKGARDDMAVLKIGQDHAELHDGQEVLQMSCPAGGASDYSRL